MDAISSVLIHFADELLLYWSVSQSVSHNLVINYSMTSATGLISPGVTSEAAPRGRPWATMSSPHHL